MIHIAICEDNDGDLAHLHSLLCQTQIPCDVTEYTSAGPLLLDVEAGKKHFDVFFLDIYLPDQIGIEAARLIRERDEKAVLIFLSSSEDFYREAFDLYAFHYLIKPATLASLTEVLTRAADHVAAPEETLHVTSRGQDVMLRHADIVYIESFSHVLHFHVRNGQECTAYGKLDEIGTRLASDLFVRCHKSFIVNLLHVKGLSREGFHIGDVVIPISRTYAADAKDSYRRRLFGIFREQ